MSHVYLAGPMTGQLPEEARVWRVWAAFQLRREGVEARSPLRAKPSIEPGATSRIDCNASGKGLWVSDSALTDRDRNDCTTADAILMCLNGASVSVGTMIELGWADAYNIPIIGFCGNFEQSLYNHPMVRRLVTLVVPDVKQGVRAILDLLDR